jgi:hypothetical protein
VIVPIMGAFGGAGGLLMTMSADSSEIQPAWLVTLKLYVPGLRSERVVVVPVPAMEPGLRIHTPDAGRPVRTTLPVVSAHDAGWVMVPATGAVGAVGAAFITTSADGSDIQPASLVT